MTNIMKSTALLLLIMTGAQANAFTSDQLFATALTQGIAQGELTGDAADRIQKETHSSEPTQVTLVRGDVTPEGCQLFNLTLTQPKVPTRDGGIAGDYVSVTKITACKDSQNPTPPEVLDCKVGNISCMPQH